MIASSMSIKDLLVYTVVVFWQGEVQLGYTE